MVALGVSGGRSVGVGDGQWLVVSGRLQGDLALVGWKASGERQWSDDEGGSSWVSVGVGVVGV